MFETSRDSGSRRRSKVYNNNNNNNTKTAKSSKISLLSALTVTTASSGGSGSTVTQDSYNRSQHKHRRRKHHHHHHHRERRSDSRNASVDVFDFLVEEKSQRDDSSTIGLDSSGRRDLLTEEGESDARSDEDDTEIPENDNEEPEGFYRSLSDSGISMGSSNSGALKSPLPSVAEEPFAVSHPHQPAHEMALIDPRCAWPPYSPQPYHEGYIPPPCPPPPPAVAYDVPVYPYPPYTPYGTPPSPPEADTGTPPLTIREPENLPTKPECFRSFNRVTTRLLLQMQDEIAELEHELKLLDEEADVENSLDDRSSAHDHGARERRLREAEVYDDLYIKIDNYYHAIEMMQKVDSISSPAMTSDLSKYHKWLDSRIVETPRIRPMISNDLRKFSSQSSQPSDQPASVLNTANYSFEPRYLAYCCLINAVIPLILFKLFNGVLNRLIVLSLVVFAGAIAQERLRSTIGRDELTCILVCVCISAFAAVCL